MLKPMPKSPSFDSGSLPDQPARRAFSNVSRDMPGSIVLNGHARVLAVGGWNADRDLGLSDRCTGPGGINEAVDGIIDEFGQASPLLEVDFAEHLQHAWRRCKIQFLSHFSTFAPTLDRDFFTVTSSGFVV